VPTLELSRRIYCRSRSTYPRLIVDPCREFVAADLTENGHRRATRLYERSSPRPGCKAMCGVTCGGHCVPRVTTQWWSYAISVTARCRRSERRLTLLICHASTWSALEPHRSRDIWQARTEPIQANFNESRDYCIVIVPCLLIKAALKGNNRKPLTTLIPCKYAWLRSINTLVHCNSKE